MTELKEFKIEQFGSYRFIGKSIYARAGMQCGKSNFAGFLWDNSEWIFEKLDDLKEYATNEIHNAAFLTWEKYDEKTMLLGYTVGRFMKADTPVPDGMDYFDITDTFVAKGWFAKEDGDCERLVKNAIEQQEEYVVQSWRFMVEVEAKDAFGYYIACGKKE